ncbi:MAG TPA: pitrilysin family protein [Candidatus Saccharimonadales bacterium]|nr:pitrilysin family protein [Candidatus Saccharimonadales bacterium]
MSLEKASLDNGLSIYVDRIPGANTNDVTMFVPFGSVDETPGDEGVAHAFEHCVHLQTDEFEDRTALRQYAKLNGMETNANTYYTRTLYYANGLDLEPNVNYLSQILRHTHFPEDKVEHEMKAIRREAVTRLDSPSEAHIVASQYAMFGAPYGRSVIGFHDKLDFEADELKKLHAQHYKLGNMALVVSGAAKLDEVANLAERYFEGDEVPFQPTDSELAVSLGQDRSTAFIREDSQNVRLRVSYPMTPEFREKYNENRLALGIASSAMRESAFQALRYDKGISYDGGVTIAAHNHPNAWSIGGYVTTDQENIDTAQGVFANTFQKHGSEYSDEDINGALAMYKYYFSKYLTSTEDRSDHIVSKLESYRQPIDIRSVLRRLKKTTPQDVRAALDEIVEFAANTDKYTHVTGKKSAVGDVDRIITQEEIG